MTNVERKRRRTPHQPTGRWIRNDKRFAIYLRDGFTCLVCGAFCLADVRSLDHVVPRSKGGSNEAKNLFLACLSCNSSRQTVKLTAEVRARVRRHTRRSLVRPLALAREMFRRGQLHAIGKDEVDV